MNSELEEKIKGQGWSEYSITPSSYAAQYKHADRFFQKFAGLYCGEKIYINVYFYEHSRLNAGVSDGWTIDVQLQDFLKGRTLNFELFGYKEVDFDKFESDAHAVINRLIGI